MESTDTFADVKDIVVQTLGIQDRADTLDGSTPLLGSLPELDSLAVLELVTALEERFGIDVDESEITGEVFETLGSLANFVDAERTAT
jgi:acyl carrier protein